MKKSCLFIHLPDEIAAFYLKEPLTILINSDDCPSKRPGPARAPAAWGQTHVSITTAII